MRRHVIETLLLDLLDRQCSPDGRIWLERVSARLSADYGRATALDAFAEAARRVGRSAVTLTYQELRNVERAGALPIGCWTMDEVGRAALLMRAVTWAPEPEWQAMVEECYRHGDTPERRAVLRILPILPRPECFLDLAMDACRAHIQDLFEAIACENPYPAGWFPAPHFNQLILKALCTGVRLGRVIGLEQRMNPDLGRMARAYASERRAAGRPVPADVARLATDERTVS